MKKSLIYLFIYFICLPSFGYAQLHLSNYYPDSLLSLRESLKEQSLKTEQEEQLIQKLYETLTMVHLQRPDKRDLLVERCPKERPENADCIQQVTGISYQEARKYLFGLLHLEKENNQYRVRDEYCQEDYDERSGVGPMRIPNHNVINCEHTWPQSKFNPRQSTSLQKTDLHHLFPVDSRANSSRGNIPFGEVREQTSNICGASQRGPSLISGALAFEPPDEHKGNVARAVFYFALRYQVNIPDEEEAYLRKWNQLDPVDESERLRNEKIYAIQANRNPFIDDPELISLIKDL